MEKVKYFWPNINGDAFCGSNTIYFMIICVYNIFLVFSVIAIKDMVLIFDKISFMMNITRNDLLPKRTKILYITNNLK